MIQNGNLIIVFTEKSYQITSFSEEFQGLFIWATLKCLSPIWKDLQSLLPKVKQLFLSEGVNSCQPSPECSSRDRQSPFNLNYSTKQQWNFGVVCKRWGQEKSCMAFTSHKRQRTLWKLSNPTDANKTTWAKSSMKLINQLLASFQGLEEQDER